MNALRALTAPEQKELTLSSPAGWNVSETPIPGVTINADTILQITTAWRCIRLISETIGTLPLILYRKTDRGVEKAEDHSLFNILYMAPNQYITSVDWVESMVVSLAVWGQSYNEIERFGRRDRIVSITPVAKTQVTPQKRGDSVVWIYTDSNGQRREMQKADICPIRGFGATGELEGLPPHKLNKSALALTKAAEQYGADFFGQSGRPDGVFQGPDWPSPENVTLFDKLFRKRTGSPLFIGGGFDYKPITRPNNESQFIETRELQMREVANIWGVPADRILAKSDATYNNSEQRNMQFLQSTLTPYIRRIEQSLMINLLTRAERKEYRIKFNVNGLLRGDSKSRAEYYSVMRGIAAMTANEVRDKEELPMIDGADELHMPLNMGPISGPAQPEEVENVRAMPT